MIVTFDIPNAKLQRLIEAVGTEGFVFNPSEGTTELTQRKKFLKEVTINYWQSIVFDYERQLAIDAEPNDSAAAQAKRFVDLSDITGVVN